VQAQHGMRATAPVAPLRLGTHHTLGCFELPSQTYGLRPLNLKLLLGCLRFTLWMHARCV
jgi:hypothetical protein